MKTKNVIYIILDGCRIDYINKKNTPFIHSISKKSLKTDLMPSPGFADRAVLLSGCYPETINCFSELEYSFKQTHLIKFLYPFRRVQYNEKIRHFINKYLRLTSGNIFYNSGKIPLEYLSNFSYSKNLIYYMKLDNIDNKYPHLFRILNNKYHCKFGFEKINKSDLLRKKSFNIIHFHDLDYIGHKYLKTGKEEIRNVLQKTDSEIEKIYNMSSKLHETSLIISGDHGMMKIKKTFDLWSEIEKDLGKIEKEVAFFIGSSVSTFLPFTKNAKNKIMEILDNIKYGKILNKEEKYKYNLNFRDNRFGEMMFFAKNNVAFLPDFFHRETDGIQGMHGYLPNKEILTPFFIHNNSITPKTIKQRKVVDVLPTIIDAAGVKMKYKTDGRSFLYD